MLKIRFVFLFYFFLVSHASMCDEYFGVIEPWQVIRVGSPSLGIVDVMPVDRGDRVVKGDLLAKINSDIESFDFSLAQKRYELAENRYRRQSSMLYTKLASEEEVEKAMIEMQLASLEMQRSKRMLERKNITSPIDGVIINRLVKISEYVYEQVPVIELAQTNPLSVELLVPFSEFNKITLGQESTVEIEELIGGSYVAKVEAVETVMDAASSTFGVRLRLNNPDGKIPSGVKCKVKFFPVL